MRRIAFTEEKKVKHTASNRQVYRATLHKTFRITLSHSNLTYSPAICKHIKPTKSSKITAFYRRHIETKKKSLREHALLSALTLITNQSYYIRWDIE